jgi:hypothetical protein
MYVEFGDDDYSPIMSNHIDFTCKYDRSKDYLRFTKPFINKFERKDFN